MVGNAHPTKIALLQPHDNGALRLRLTHPTIPNLVQKSNRIPILFACLIPIAVLIRIQYSEPQSDRRGAETAPSDFAEITGNLLRVDHNMTVETRFPRPR